MPAERPWRLAAAACAAALAATPAAAPADPSLAQPIATGPVGGGRFLAQYDALTLALAKDRPRGGGDAHLRLARFLIGAQLSLEAVGVLDQAAHDRLAVAGSAEFHALRGEALAMARRWPAAAAELGSPGLPPDPPLSLWRGYALAGGGDMAAAEGALAAGATALTTFPPLWRQRFARAGAEASLDLADLRAARWWLEAALASPAQPEEDARTRLVVARLAEAEGRPAAAVRLDLALARTPWDEIAAPALLRATELELAEGRAPPALAARSLRELQFRWRGDGVEAQASLALARLDEAQGRYGEALAALRAAGPSTVADGERRALFETLFIDGEADRLPVLEALELYRSFQDLAPIGADGDIFARRLAAELVRADLLAEAGDVLQHQADFRLDGPARAEVATDLAAVRLLGGRPADALAALRGAPGVPPALEERRRLLAARALMELGKFDDALAALGQDDSPEALGARAEAAWRGRKWPLAGALYERLLGARYETPRPLDGEEEARLLRAAAAWSLAGDEPALERLRARWSPLVSAARRPDSLRVALAGLKGRAGPAAASALAADDALETWIARMKAEFAKAAAAAGG